MPRMPRLFAAWVGVAAELRPAVASRATTWLLLAIVIPLATLSPVAAYRFLDGDEGDYAAASALVLDGRVLYHDFLYTQTPLLPYVYGAWSQLVGEQWLWMRALSVVFAIALAVLLYRHLTPRTGHVLATTGVALFSLSSLVITWYPTMKTYALSTVLLFGAYVLVDRASLDGGRAAVAGALSSLSVETRALMLGGVVVLLWAVWRESVRRLAQFGVGFAVALVPSFVLVGIDAQRFLFGNLWYHGARSESGLVGDFEQKAEVVANLLGVATEARPLPQFLLLALTSVAAAGALRVLTGHVPLALLVAAGLALVSLLPTPTYTQYFATSIPFLVVGVVLLVRELNRQGVGAARPFLFAFSSLGAAAYVLFGVIDLYRAISPSRENRPAQVQAVADYVNANTAAGEEVVSSWPGYLFGTHAAPVPGLENGFSTHEAAALSEDEAHRQRLVTAMDVETMIQRRRTRLVVVKVWHDLPPIPDYDGAARKGGYRLAAQINTVRVYAVP
jgi:hypothetical protein